MEYDPSPPCYQSDVEKFVTNLYGTFPLILLGVFGDCGRHWDGWKRACHKLMLLEHLKLASSVIQRLWVHLDFKDYVSRRHVPSQSRVTIPAADCFLVHSG
ncbi:hypothetical protein TNCV_3638701 [Trichonephila clavipes]|nr:hypothetical protein TNCV_3638701 [Trichonephila clavipes]